MKKLDRRKYRGFGFSWLSLHGKRIRGYEYYAPGNAHTVEAAKRELIDDDDLPEKGLRAWPLRKRKRK